MKQAINIIDDKTFQNRAELTASMYVCMEYIQANKHTYKQTNKHSEDSCLRGRNNAI